MGKRKSTGKSLMKCVACQKFIGEDSPCCDSCEQRAHEECLKSTEDGVKLCPACYESLIEETQEEEEVKATISVTDDEGNIHEADLDEMVEVVKSDEEDPVKEDAREVIAAFSLSALKDEMMRRDAQQMTFLRRKIMNAEIKIKQLRDQVKSDSSEVDRLGSKLSRAVLDPQLYLDEIKQELEEEQRLRSGPDRRQLTLHEQDPTELKEDPEHGQDDPEPPGESGDGQEDGKENSQGGPEDPGSNDDQGGNRGQEEDQN